MKIKSSTILAILLGIVFFAFIFWAVYNQYEEYVSQYDDKLVELRKIVRGIDPEVDEVMRYATLHAGEKSYTLNKEKIHLCLRDENGKYYDNNMLLYVLLHELAHVMCDEIGHTKKFDAIFDELLTKAEKAGIYDGSIPPVSNYCNY